MENQNKQLHCTSIGGNSCLLLLLHESFRSSKTTHFSMIFMLNEMIFILNGTASYFNCQAEASAAPLLDSQHKVLPDMTWFFEPFFGCRFLVYPPPCQIVEKLDVDRPFLQ